MKKLAVIFGILVLLTVFLTYPAVAATETFILGYDFPGEKNYGESGLTIAGESLYNLGKVFTLGYGVEVPLHTLKSPQIFNFVPVFGILKVAPFPASFPLDFTARAGYSYLVGDSNYTSNATLQGGSYYGYGMGYFFDKNTEEGSYTKLELLYSACKGTYTSGGVTTSPEYSRWSIIVSFGYEGL